MLLIMFMGLVANLALVSGDCSVGSLSMTNFDYNRVGTGVFILSLRQELFKILLLFIFNLCCH
jgi:hypothetical protein